MPLAKFKFVVSCSDSEKNFGAENLIGKGKTGRTKWRGKAGTSSNVAVLQMERECRIKSVDIGNEFSALISVLVSKSCDPKQNFQALIPSSSFMDPMESRLAKNGNRVRMFEEGDMIVVTAKQKWDVVKIVCSQPFNQTTPYGISFITVTVDGDETDKSTSRSPNTQISKTSVPKIPLITRVEAVQRTLKAGEMFKNKDNYKDIPVQPVPRTSKENETGEGGETKGLKLGKHKRRPDTSPKTKRLKLTPNKENEASFPNAAAQNVPSHRITLKASPSKAGTPKASPSKAGTPKASPSKATAAKKPLKTESVEQKEPHIVKKKPLNEILRGVRFSLSGYQNPQRSILRDKAKEMGAVYENDWSSRCTHLVCAFRDTPKYRQVGKSGFIVTDKWIDMCYIQKKRLPERQFVL